MNDDKITNQLEADLRILGLPFMLEHHALLAAKAARDSLTHDDYLTRLIEGELNLRRDKATVRRIKNAHFPVVKTLDQFSWSWLSRAMVIFHFSRGRAKVICHPLGQGYLPV